MSYDTAGQTALDYFPCRYGTSKLLFRGPRRRLQGAYTAFIGGTETYGKFVVEPFPALVEQATGLRSVNLGCTNAGIDAFVTDKSLVDICAGAKVTVIQISGAQNMSNRFYAVHPRRNDRFLRASTLLRTIYGEVDFTDFHFTRHLLNTLEAASPEKFAMVRQELKDAWVARMKTLIEQIGGKVVLLWMADHAPGDAPDADRSETAPMFIDTGMIDALRGDVDAVVEVVAEPADIEAGLDEMVFAPLEEPAVRGMLGAAVHRRVADALAPVIEALH